MAGEPCDLNQISKFCKKKKLILIEDCAHSLGTFLTKNMLVILVFQEVFLFILQNKLQQEKVE